MLSTIIIIFNKLFYRVLPLGIGEIISRLSSFALVAYVARYLGIELLGVLALGQTLAQYVVVGTDLGTKQIGARLVAKDISLAHAVVWNVQKKRVLLAVFFIMSGCLYALLGPIPENSRFFSLGLIISLIPYAFVLDWLIWGLDRLMWLGLWRAGVSLLFTGGAVIGIHFIGLGLVAVTLANGLSMAIGAMILWGIWVMQLQPRVGQPDKDKRAFVEHEIGWEPVFLLGLATILNQMFHNLDTLLLGAMSTAVEVGLYSAAYKVLFLIFGGYYLFTQSAFPALARLKNGDAERKVILKYAALAAGFGAAIAFVVGLFAQDILMLFYGPELVSATNLLRILVLGLPMEFAVALLGTSLVSWGYNKIAVITTGLSAIFNFVLNLYLIPKLLAVGAAWATVASYCLLLLIFCYFFTSKRNYLKTRGAY